jgi:hypothetical protein
MSSATRQSAADDRRGLDGVPPEHDLWAVPAGAVSPSVLGDEPAQDVLNSAVARVFVLCGQIPSGGEAAVELRTLTDGRAAMLAYTRWEALIAACGNHQPWMLVDHAAVDRLQQYVGADVVLWDAELPPELRHHSR